MCTVTYLPQPDGSYVLSHNRDEAPERGARQILRQERQQEQIVFPQDAGAGGTWITLGALDRVACLLNGAYTNHERKPPYRMSRGIMVLEYHDYPDVHAFRQNFNFSGMEPFTMLVVEGGQPYQMVWDAQSLAFEELQAKKSYIWSSATLYDQEMRAERVRWFREWLDRETNPGLSAARFFHRYAGNGDPRTDVVMNRDNIVRTVSITHIVRDSTQIELQYEDLIHGSQSKAKVDLQRGPLESGEA